MGIKYGKECPDFILTFGDESVMSYYVRREKDDGASPMSFDTAF
jgi:hypothetical protein